MKVLSGKGVHIVTVNDYLAKRDSEWMGTIYKFLGISVILLQNGMRLSLKNLHMRLILLTVQTQGWLTAR